MGSHYVYATGDQFNVLLSGYTGAVNYGYTFTTVPGGSVEPLILMLGVTSEYSGAVASINTFGFIADWFNELDSSVRFIAQISEFYYSDGAAYAAHYFADVVFAKYDDTGSFLVRDTREVSEPASIALLALSLLGMGIVRKRS